jgi:hypothetical protein
MNLQAYEQFIKGLTKFIWICKPNSDLLLEFKYYNPNYPNPKFEPNSN